MMRCMIKYADMTSDTIIIIVLIIYQLNWATAYAIFHLSSVPHPNWSSLICCGQCTHSQAHHQAMAANLPIETCICCKRLADKRKSKLMVRIRRWKWNGAAFKGIIAPLGDCINDSSTNYCSNWVSLVMCLVCKKERHSSVRHRVKM